MRKLQAKMRAKMKAAQEKRDLLIVHTGTGKGKTTDDGKILPMDVKAGDKILYGKYSGSEIKLDDEEYLIMHQDDILGILK